MELALQQKLLARLVTERSFREQFFADPARVAAADPQTIRQLFTVHVRKDRFCDGHLWQMVSCGHIAALLRRLGEIRGGDAKKG